jgi:hypothetical protein
MLWGMPPIFGSSASSFMIATQMPSLGGIGQSLAEMSGGVFSSPSERE